MGVHRRVTWGAMVLVVCACLVASGCASGGESSGATAVRVVPPEVTDRTLDPYIDDQPVERPYLTVTIERVDPVEYDVRGAEALVQREGLRCYRLGLQQDAGLDGAIVFELMVTTNGRVAGIDRMSTSFESERVEGCLERVMYRLRFDVQAGRGPMFSRLYVRVDLQREVFEEATLTPGEI